MSTGTKFETARPFYWERGVERVTNGRYTIELYYWNNGRDLVPSVSIELPDASNINGTVYPDGLRYDYPERAPEYVRSAARKLARRVFA